MLTSANNFRDNRRTNDGQFIPVIPLTYRVRIWLITLENEKLEEVEDHVTRQSKRFLHYVRQQYQQYKQSPK